MIIHRRWYSFWICIVLFFAFAQVGSADDTVIRSKVSFLNNSQSQIIHFAGIDVPDQLKVCPLETLPVDLVKIVKGLVQKVRDSVDRIKATQSDHCSDLEKQMAAAQAQVGTAVTNQFAVKASIASKADQDQINAYTQQANAVNLLIMTASGLMQRNCITKLDDRIVIQRLIGQVVTIGGLLMGGWQGIATAAGGQFIGNLPLFKSDIDVALENFQKYDEVNEKGSFLCLFRQMQKTSCLMFATERDQTIQGLDMTYETGPVQTTKKTISTFENEAPNLFHDVIVLHNIASSSEDLIAFLGKKETRHDGSSALFREVLSWCNDRKLDSLKSEDIHPDSILTSLSFVQETCKNLKEMTVEYETQKEAKKVLDEFRWHLISISSYYHSIKKDEKSPMGAIAKTWESLKFFEGFKKNVEDFSNPSAGNLARLNYLQLTESLAKHLVRTSFKTMFKEHYNRLMQKKYKWITRHIRIPWMEPVLDNRVRQRALIAMLDLCQTLDPTLTCLYPSDPSRHSLQKEWAKRCVGPKSELCQDVLIRKEKKILIQDKKYLEYFNSLCGENE